MGMMIEPGDHEDVALSRSQEGDHETATVYAMLAIASAINKLADAVENKD